jgi:4-hydroxy-4-methyl-2-oxoglutarate aldolase
MNGQLSQQTLAMLAKFDTPTICNVIERFAVRSQTEGYADGRLVANYPKQPPMVGYAATATFRGSEPAQAGGAYSSLEDQVASFKTLPSPNIVVIEDLDDPIAGAAYGEMLCTTYKAFGCVGLVTSGAGRDISQIEAFDFPTFTTSTVCSHAYPQFISVNVPVKICGMAVRPGDLLHGDCNGVTTIPLEITGKLVAACEEFLEAEETLMETIRNNGDDFAIFEQAFKELFAKFGEIGDRLQKK